VGGRPPCDQDSEDDEERGEQERSGIANLLGPALFAQTLAFSIAGGGGYWSGP
jgi:hypothetical protein